MNGTEAGAYGTSAACPIVAGMLALINDKLLAAGKKPLGFVNPLLYKHPEVSPTGWCVEVWRCVGGSPRHRLAWDGAVQQAFHDILQGHNDDGMGAGAPGFNATKGRERMEEGRGGKEGRLWGPPDH